MGESFSMTNFVRAVHERFLVSLVERWGDINTLTSIFKYGLHILLMGGSAFLCYQRGNTRYLM